MDDIFCSFTGVSHTCTTKEMFIFGSNLDHLIKEHKVYASRVNFTFKGPYDEEQQYSKIIGFFF